MPSDPCLSLFKPNTRSYCACRYILSVKTTSPRDVAAHCSLKISTVRHVLSKMESARLIRRVYYDDVNYTIVTPDVLAPPSKW